MKHWRYKYSMKWVGKNKGIVIQREKEEASGTLGSMPPWESDTGERFRIDAWLKLGGRGARGTNIFLTAFVIFQL